MFCRSTIERVKNEISSVKSSTVEKQKRLARARSTLDKKKKEKMELQSAIAQAESAWNLEKENMINESAKFEAMASEAEDKLSQQIESLHQGLSQRL